MRISSLVAAGWIALTPCICCAGEAAPATESRPLAALYPGDEGIERDPRVLFVDDFETGTVAAAFGGTTSIVDFAIQQRGGTLRQAWETWMGKAEGKAAVDYGFHMILSEHTPALEAED